MEDNVISFDLQRQVTLHLCGGTYQPLHKGLEDGALF